MTLRGFIAVVRTVVLGFAVLLFPLETVASAVPHNDHRSDLARLQIVRSSLARRGGSHAQFAHQSNKSHAHQSQQSMAPFTDVAIAAPSQGKRSLPDRGRFERFGEPLSI